MCSSGLSYITIDNYKPRNNRSQDDVRFEFKSSQSSGMIMYAKGIHRDFIYVAYKDNRVFMLHIDLGTGNGFVTFFTAHFIMVCAFAANNIICRQYPKTWSHQQTILYVLQPSWFSVQMTSAQVVETLVQQCHWTTVCLAPGLSQFSRTWCAWFCRTVCVPLLPQNALAPAGRGKATAQEQSHYSGNFYSHGWKERKTYKMIAQ